MDGTPPEDVFSNMHTMQFVDAATRSVLPGSALYFSVGIVCALGLVGNVMLYMTTRHPKMKVRTFLVSVCLSACLYIFTSIPSHLHSTSLSLDLHNNNDSVHTAENKKTEKDKWCFLRRLRYVQQSVSLRWWIC